MPSKWGLCIVCVGNDAGFDTFTPNNTINDKWMYTLSKSCTTHLAAHTNNNKTVVRVKCHPCDWPHTQTWEARPLPRTKAFKNSRWEPTTQREHEWQVPDLSESVPLEATPPPPLRFDWRHFYYTDRSAITQAGRGASIAAAVYKPADSHDDMTRMTTMDCTITGGPGMDGVDKYQPNVNTINRAELMGIRAAYMLPDPGPRDDIHIATDSQTPMYQIHKMITRTQDMQVHGHHNILTDTVHRLHSSQATLHLRKVTSHTGVYGNDMADYMAVEVATERQKPTVDDTVQSNDRENHFWPYSIEEYDMDTGPRREHIPLANLCREPEDHGQTQMRPRRSRYYWGVLRSMGGTG